MHQTLGGEEKEIESDMQKSISAPMTTKESYLLFTCFYSFLHEDHSCHLIFYERIDAYAQRKERG